jgi:hypothetical protein
MGIVTFLEYIGFFIFLFVFIMLLGPFVGSTSFGFVIPLIFSFPLLYGVLQCLFTEESSFLKRSEDSASPSRDAMDGRLNEIQKRIIEESVKAQENVKLYLLSIVAFFAGSLAAYFQPQYALYAVIGIVALITFLYFASTSEEELQELSDMLRTGREKGPISKNPEKAVKAFTQLVSFVLFLPLFSYFLIGILYWGIMLALAAWIYQRTT